VSASTFVRAVLPAVTINLVAGSLYSLSVVLRALEQHGGGQRSLVSAGFSVATVAFLIGVLTFPATAARFGPQSHIGLASLIGAAAVFSAATTPEISPALVVAALLYGMSCGHLYCAALGMVKRARLSKPGLAAGIAIAGFAAGSILWSLVLGSTLSRFGLHGALLVLSGAFVTTALVVPMALKSVRQTGAEDSASHAFVAPILRSSARRLALLWFGFFAVSAAGLGVISQSALFMTSLPGLEAATLTAIVGLANGTGRIVGGALSDRLPASALLAQIAFVTALALGAGALLEGLGFIVSVVLVALCYGAASGAYPAVLIKTASPEHFPAQFARLFTGWGAAALLAPLAFALGWDRHGDYAPVLLLAAALNLTASVLLGTVLRKS
jgi:MFS family permease